MTAPLCRCRVLYIGSSVPTVTKDGLQGIQQPLKERYPANESTETKGIDSWLSVWSNGLLLEYMDGAKKTENTFFPIPTLHYCAAVRYVNVTGFSIEGGGERFIPLDTPFAQIPDSPHPPIFAAIFRRTTGVKVLECHAFICTNEKAANALVRCCFHSYADTIYLKMDDKVPGLKAIKESSRSASNTPSSELNLSEQENGAPDDIRDEANWNERAIGQKTWQRRQQNGEYDAASLASSLYKKSPKKNGRHRESRSEFFENEGALMPYGGDPNPGYYNRRSGSHSELRGSGTGEYYEPAGSNYSLYDRGPPNAMHYGPPGHGPPFPQRGGFGGMPPAHHPGGFLPPPPPPAGFFGGRGPHSGGPPHAPYFGMPFGIPPPHMMPPPPPPHMRSRFPGAGGPPMPPQMGPMPYPPHMMPPRCVFFMPPFGPFPPPPPHLMHQGKPHSDGSTNGGGPIITESVYDTFPRNRGTTYEEPIYMPSNSGTMPPHSSYKPGSMSPEHYEGYYETYRQQRHPERKNASGSDSEASAEGSNQFWEAYEAGIYRKAHINEKAFANSVAADYARNGQASGNVNGSMNGDADGTLRANKKGDNKSGTHKSDFAVIRPDTPPADYDQEHNNNHHPSPAAAKNNNSNSNTTQRATVY